MCYISEFDLLWPAGPTPEVAWRIFMLPRRLESGMMEEVRVRKAGGSLTIVLPSAMTKKLGIAAGARLWIAETHDGLIITQDDAGFQGLAEEVSKASSDYWQVLKALRPE